MAEDDALFQKGMPIRREVAGAGIRRRLNDPCGRIYDVVPAGDYRLGLGLGVGRSDARSKKRSLGILTNLTKGALNNGVTVTCSLISGARFSAVSLDQAPANAATRRPMWLRRPLLPHIR